MSRRKYWQTKTHCPCGAQNWDDVTDAQTGTAYVRCRQCGRHHLVSKGGYVDWSVGVMMQSAEELGSEWTRSALSTYFARPSEVTT